MNTEIQDLENSILAMENQFAQNLPIDVADLIAKTKKLTALQVEQAREEGLRAGLVVKELKEKKAKQEEAPFQGQGFTPPQAPKQTQEQVFIPSQGENKTQGFSPKVPNLAPPTLSQNNIPQIPPIPFNLKEKIPSKTKLSELNLGKYVMGVLAAILALTGTIVLGSLVWQDLTNETKALGLLLLASLMTFLPFRHIMVNREGESNGFFNSVMGAGLSIYYITTIFMGTTWGFFGETILLFALVGLILLTVLISHHIKSNTLLLVSFIGNFYTLALLSTRELSLASLQIGLVLLLATFLFLLGYTMKNTWTTGIVKGASLFFALCMMLISHETLAHSRYTLSPFMDFADVASPLFSAYVITLLFAVLISLTMGACLSRSDHLSLGIMTFHPHGIGLFFTYVALSACHFHYGILYLCLILCTFFFSQDKSTATVISFPYVVAGLMRLTDDLYQYLQPIDDGQTVFFYLCVTTLAFFIHFTSKWTENKRCAFASFAYGLVSFAVIMSDLNHVLYVIPLLILLCCYFVEGYQKALGKEILPVIYLSSFIPMAYLCASMFHEVFPLPSSQRYYYAPFLLIFASGLSISGRYFVNIQENEKFQKILTFFKVIPFFYVCGRLHGRIQTLDLIFFETIALLLFMGEMFYLVLSPNPPYFKRKAVPLLLILWGLISWTHTSALGDFSYTSSILILSMGCLSIYLGFYQKEVELRHLGLGLAILAVLKMVTVDIASSDSIVRVLALIMGAILCFGISCVYNRLPALMGEPPIEPVENKEEIPPEETE